tara:strand:- start:971 stop:1465 length:495 start_codon:yes stop_codon:yes gene_type:complete
MDTNKNDLFKYGGKSEFFGHSKQRQKEKLKAGLEIFKKNGVKIRSFFAPNHTYDLNTLEALKELNIKIVIDGYGLKPYLKDDVKFIPQLFYKLFFLPFGIQSTQIHLNNWEDKDFNNFERFIKKNFVDIINFDEAISFDSNRIIDSLLNFSIKKILLMKRKILN